MFDLDGTLVDSAPSIAQSVNQLLFKRGRGPVPVPFVRRWISHGATDLVANCLGDSATTPQRDLEEFRAIHGQYRASAADLYPYVEATLRRLTDMGIKLAICTNKPQDLTENLLDVVGIAPLFCAVIGGDVCPQPKPHPSHLLLALQTMGENPRDAVYVGDSEIDAQAAAGAKIPFIFANYGYAMGSPDAILCQARISCLDQLTALLPNMNQD